MRLSGTSLVAYGPPLPPTSGPNAPTNLAAAATGSATIDLNWTDNSNNEDGFAIEESIDGKNFTQIATVGVNVTTVYRLRPHTAGDVLLPRAGVQLVPGSDLLRLYEHRQRDHAHVRHAVAG